MRPRPALSHKFAREQQPHFWGLLDLEGQALPAPPLIGPAHVGNWHKTFHDPTLSNNWDPPLWRTEWIILVFKMFTDTYHTTPSLTPIENLKTTPAATAARTKSSAQERKGVSQRKHHSSKYKWLKDSKTQMTQRLKEEREGYALKYQTAECLLLSRETTGWTTLPFSIGDGNIPHLEMFAYRESIWSNGSPVGHNPPATLR